MELVKKEPWVQVCDCKPWALPALQPHHARWVHPPSYNQPPAYPEKGFPGSKCALCAGIAFRDVGIQRSGPAGETMTQRCSMTYLVSQAPEQELEPV